MRVRLRYCEWLRLRLVLRGGVLADDAITARLHELGLVTATAVTPLGGQVLEKIEAIAPGFRKPQQYRSRHYRSAHEAQRDAHWRVLTVEIGGES